MRLFVRIRGLSPFVLDWDPFPSPSSSQPLPKSLEFDGTSSLGRYSAVDHGGKREEERELDEVEACFAPLRDRTNRNLMTRKTKEEEKLKEIQKEMEIRKQQQSLLRKLVNKVYADLFEGNPPGPISLRKVLSFQGGDKLFEYDRDSRFACLDPKDMEMVSVYDEPLSCAEHLVWTSIQEQWITPTPFDASAETFIRLASINRIILFITDFNGFDHPIRKYHRRVFLTMYRDLIDPIRLMLKVKERFKPPRIDHFVPSKYIPSDGKKQRGSSSAHSRRLSVHHDFHHEDIAIDRGASDAHGCGSGGRCARHTSSDYAMYEWMCVQIQQTTARFFAEWVEMCPFDFIGDLRMEQTAIDFIEEIRMNGHYGIASAVERMLLTHSNCCDEPKNPFDSIAMETGTAKPAIFLASSAEEMGKQMCLISSRLYRSIQWQEFLKMAWSKEKYHHLAPNLRWMIAHFNRIGNWIATSIIAQDTEQRMIKALTRAIEILIFCRKWHDYLSCLSIIGGLGTAPIFRLKPIWDRVKKSLRAEFDSIEEELGPKSNYKSLRELLQSHSRDGDEGPCVPYVGLFTRDLTFNEDGKPRFMDGMVNFQKCMSLFQCIFECLRFQDREYPFALNSNVMNMFLSHVVRPDAELQDLSEAILPPKYKRKKIYL
jgi:hypothetical protein